MAHKVFLHIALVFFSHVFAILPQFHPWILPHSFRKCKTTNQPTHNQLYQNTIYFNYHTFTRITSQKRSWNIICCRNQLLPGQFCSLQVSSCLELPSHFPLYFSVTVLLLNFVFLPPPQLLEHEPISQLLHSQFTKYQQEINYIIRSSYTVSNEIV